MSKTTTKPVGAADKAKAVTDEAPETTQPARAADKVKPVKKAAPETAAYITGACPILLDGKHYAPGAEIVLTEAQAARLGTNVTAIAVAPLSTPLE